MHDCSALQLLEPCCIPACVCVCSLAGLATSAFAEPGCHFAFSVQVNWGVGGSGWWRREGLYITILLWSPDTRQGEE